MKRKSVAVRGWEKRDHPHSAPYLSSPTQRKAKKKAWGGGPNNRERATKCLRGRRASGERSQQTKRDQEKKANP